MEQRAIIEASSIDVLGNKRRPGRSCVKRSDIQTARIECFGPGPFLPNPDEMRFSTRSRTNEYLFLAASVQLWRFLALGGSIRKAADPVGHQAAVDALLEVTLRYEI